MDDFLCEVQCDEQYMPTQEDWAEYVEYVESCEQPDEFQEWVDYEFDAQNFRLFENIFIRYTMDGICMYSYTCVN